MASLLVTPPIYHASRSCPRVLVALTWHPCHLGLSWAPPGPGLEPAASLRSLVSYWQEWSSGTILWGRLREGGSFKALSGDGDRIPHELTRACPAPISAKPQAHSSLKETSYSVSSPFPHSKCGLQVTGDGRTEVSHPYSSLHPQCSHETKARPRLGIFCPLSTKAEGEPTARRERDPSWTCVILRGPGHLQPVRRKKLSRTPQGCPSEGHTLVTGSHGHGLLH